MKKIGIDARLYYQTGVGVYLRNLIHWLQKQSDNDTEYYIYVLRSDSKSISFSNKNFIKKEVNVRWHSLAEQTQFLTDLYRDNLDLMHFTYFGYPILYNRPYIATVHDITPLVFKTGKASTKNLFAYSIKHLFFRLVLSKQIKNAKLIITPTNTVKEQITNFYGKKYAEKIRVIKEGLNYEIELFKNKDSQQDIREQLNLRQEEPFFIYVGNFYPHKNIDRLIEAFASPNIRIKLILIGPKDMFADRLAKKIRESGLSEKIIFFHNYQIKYLTYFYQHALALIQPSLSEGFGLPIIEAMHYNLPVIASDIPVFQELLGENYLSFDPLSVNSIKAKIKYFITKQLRFNYGGLLHKYSFSKMAEETNLLYKKI